MIEVDAPAVSLGHLAVTVPSDWAPR